ncbi:MAG: tRNA lysidine(34) synthetase TilS [Micropepsaceae bacterium]
MQVETAFAAALGVLEPPPAFAVAVSGGPDSTALMRLAAPMKPLVLTVDHGLRAGAAAEAEAVAGWAAALGLRHRILTWTGAKPARGIQEAARAARYRLLAAACLEAGLTALMTGHTLDDQIETVAMRRGRGSGDWGAAGIPAQAELPDAPVRLMRPLIGLRKAMLTAWLDGGGHPYFRDPSNSDPRFARARLRAGGAEASLADMAALQRARAAAERAAVAALSGAEVTDGAVLVAQPALAGLDPAALDAALAALLRVAGGQDHPGTRAERDRLAAAVREGGFPGRTLAGVMIRPARRREGPPGTIAFLPEGGGKVKRRHFWLPFGQFSQIFADGAAV